MKLHPYHNPAGLDESKVPDGWRFAYQGEYIDTHARFWAFSWVTGFSDWSRNIRFRDFAPRDITMIVPVDA